ncbi:MAG: rod shape-determining protein [Clostridia bacterium]|nr:rod shape-determining protein [Clostridia bacterium]
MGLLGNLGIGIDLGTATVLVYVKGKGIVLREPSVVAIDRTTGNVLKVGKEAQYMLGRTPGNIVAVRPMKDGVINQYDITLKMIRHFIRKAIGPTVIKPTLVICVPSGITEVEERAVEDAAIQAGARHIYLIEEPVAAAIGAGIDISQPTGNMVVDIGGGTTDIAVLSLGGVVTSESIKCAGDAFDAAIMRYVRKVYKVDIGERTAEEIKKQIGCVWRRPQPKMIEVKGRSIQQGLPVALRLSSEEMPQALSEPIFRIVESVCRVIEKTPPELIGDILYNGIIMTGGGSLLFGIDKLIASATHIKTKVAPNAIDCVANGTGKSLDYLSSLGAGEVNLSRRRNDYQ